MAVDPKIILDNPLIWQGWRIDLPADWNPAQLTGTARRGTVIVTDLERQRLRVDWQRVRSVSAVNLDRLARGRKQAPLDWRSLAVADEGIVEGRYATTDAGETLAMLVTSKCPRLLLVQVAAGDRGRAEPIALRLLQSVADSHGGDRLAWRVFGLAFSTPGDVPLATCHFAVGRARFTFRRRRRSITIRRWSLAAGADSALDVDSDPSEMHIHLGHPVAVRPLYDQKTWDRWMRGAAWRLNFTCSETGHAFLIEATGPSARRDLLDLVGTLACHPSDEACSG